MKIFKISFLVIAISLISLVALAKAQGGACSSHDGVSCKLGADIDGSVICSDGWKDSSVQYTSLKGECGADYVEPEIFSDVAKNYKNRDAILYLKDKSIVSGYEDGTFKPENTVNRAELLTILLRSKQLSLDSTKYHECFDDVQDQWFAVPVCYAKEQNWVNGYEDGTFKPDQTVNKAEAIKMILNSQNIPIPEAVTSNPFDDVDKGIWFAPFIKVAKDIGILEETGSFLIPDQKMKRAGVSENIYRLLKYIENKPNVLLEIQTSI